MPRIRTIKPEIALHEGLFELEQSTGLPIRFVWAVLPCHCDREGRFKWRPRPLGAQILPYDGVDFSDAMEALLEGGYLVRYEVAGQQYGAMPTFTKHQSVNQRESVSDIPAPDFDEIPQGIESAQDDARICTHMHARGERKGKEGKGKERKGREGAHARTCAHPPKANGKSTDQVEAPKGLNIEAWNQYMQHRKDLKVKPLTATGRRTAMKKWAKQSPDAQQRAVDDTIANGYTGCWPDKHEDRHGPDRKQGESYEAIHRRNRLNAGLETGD